MRKQKTIAAVALTAAMAGGALVGAALGNPLASGAQDGSSSTSSTEATTTTAPKSTTTEAPKTTAPKGGTTTPKGTDEGADKGKGGPGGRGFGGPLDLEVAAKTLKLTPEELRKQLQSGKSLADIAKAQGVKKQTLIDALVKAGEARLDEAKKNLPDAVAKAVDATPPKGGGGFGGKGMRMPGIDAAAKALGITTDELMTQLKDGKTLAEIANAKGVAKSKVVDALMADAKKHSAEAVKAGKITQEQADKHLAELKTWITKWVDEGMGAMGKGGMHGPGGGRGGPGGGGPGGSGPGGPPPADAPEGSGGD